MKIQTKQRAVIRAFTLIEMIGVLAVIAILAAMLIPKVFNAINNARINSTAVTRETVKTAIADHYGQFGTLVSSNGQSITQPVTNFDTVLLGEGFLDKAVSVKIATPANTSVQAIDISGNTATTAVTAINHAFNLGSTNAAINSVVGSSVIELQLASVLEADAKAVNDLIDGASLGVAIGSSPDLGGAVRYGAASGGTVNMLIYITHR